LGGGGLRWLSGDGQMVDRLCKRRERECEMKKKKKREEGIKGLTVRENKI